MLKNLLLFGSLILLTSNGYSKTNFYQVTGSISSVEVLKTYSTKTGNITILDTLQDNTSPRTAMLAFEIITI